MKIAVVYKSLTGNTKLVAEAIGEALKAEHDVFVCEPAEDIEADMYFVGTWIDKGSCTKEIAALAPDVYVKGADYTVEKLDPEERAALFSIEAAIEFLPFVPNHSTTETINKINKSKE